MKREKNSYKHAALKDKREAQEDEHELKGYEFYAEQIARGHARIDKLSDTIAALYKENNVAQVKMGQLEKDLAKKAKYADILRSEKRTLEEKIFHMSAEAEVLKKRIEFYEQKDRR